MTIRHDILVTQLPHPYTDLNWTKADTLELFPNITIEKLSEGQIQGGIMILKKNSYTESLVRQWKDLMAVTNLHFFDDSPSLKLNNSSFIEHRHDQSIWSLILKSNHYISLPVSLFYSATKEGWKALELEPILQKKNIETISSHRFSIKKILRTLLKYLWRK